VSRLSPAAVRAAALEREVVISFNSDVADGLPWRFTPTQKSVRVKPGETTLAFFTAKNKSNVDITVGRCKLTPRSPRVDTG